MQTQVEQLLTNIWRFVYESANNNRSSKKTDMLHAGVADMLLQTISQRPTLKLRTETSSSKISIPDCYNGCFDVDLAIYDANYNVHTAIPVKMNMVSINKNRFNNANTIIGETARSIPACDPNRNVLFINFTPEITLCETNSYFKVEKVNKTDTKLAYSSPIYNQEYIADHVAIIDINYQLNLDLHSINTKSDLYTALMEHDNPISLSPGTLDSFNLYCTNFLSKNP